MNREAVRNENGPPGPPAKSQLNVRLTGTKDTVIDPLSA